MERLRHSIPDPEVLVAMSPEELGRHIIAAMGSSDDGKAHASSFDGTLFGIGSGGYEHRYRETVLQAIMEAWAWLESEALIVPTHPTSNGWCRLSRRAKRLADPKTFSEHLAAKLLPRAILHPGISEDVWMNVMRQKYDLAVFEAMRAVEIAVRDASGIDELGVKLMRRAFHPDSGPLTDLTVDVGEREARMALFAGAIGSYKNPVSHRHVPLYEAGEVIEQIMLASHLLRIVDARAAELVS